MTVTPRLEVEEESVRKQDILFCGSCCLHRNEPHPNFVFIKMEYTMAGQGSTGNVIAAVCSFFIPGLGQLVQGRALTAALHFVLPAILWWVLLGWIIHLWSIIDAARFKTS